MSLAIFDLDNTLIAGDSDHLWGEFLVRHQLVDAENFARQNDRFYLEYQKGTLDIHAYLVFALEPLTRFTPMQLQDLHKKFMLEMIEPIKLPKALALIERHRQQHDRLMIITATNRFITEPIARSLGIADLLASEPEVENGVFTGQPTGIPCFQYGKVKRLEQWLKEHDESLENSYFYSDSANDIPLLELVDNPVVVDPDDTLRTYANEREIPIISLR